MNEATSLEKRWQRSWKHAVLSDHEHPGLCGQLAGKDVGECVPEHVGSLGTIVRRLGKAMKNHSDVVRRGLFTLDEGGKRVDARIHSGIQHRR